MDKRQDKKAQFEPPARGRRILLPVLALAALLGLGAAGWLLFGQGAGGFTTVAAAGGEVAIPVADLADGQARFYRFAGRSGEVRLFLVKSRDGVVRAAFDTCDVCYKAGKGYRQEGDFMVCNNCNQQFRSDLVNEIKGGCNPAPLARLVKAGQVTIRSADLENGRRYFALAAN